MGLCQLLDELTGQAHEGVEVLFIFQGFVGCADFTEYTELVERLHALLGAAAVSAGLGCVDEEFLLFYGNQSPVGVFKVLDEGQMGSGAVMDDESDDGVEFN